MSRGPGHRGRGRGRGKGGNSVGQFLRPRTGRQANRVANAQASAEYNPEIRQLRQEAKGSRKRQRDLGQWYGELASDYAQSQQAGQEAFQATQDTISKQLAEASERGKSQLEGLSREDEEFAKLVGGPKDTRGLAEIAKAAAAAERARVGINAPTAQEGANFLASLGGHRTAARMQGIESRKEEARRRDKLRSDLTGVRREKGAARVAKKEDIRQADRAYASELKQLRLARREARSAEQQAAADAAIAQVEAAREARQDAISNRQAQERIGISRGQLGVSRRNARTSEKGDRGGMTPSQRRTARRNKNSANVAARTLYKSAGSPNWSNKQWNVFVQRVAMEEGIDYTAAQKAVAALRRQQGAKKGKKGRKSIIGKVFKDMAK